MGRHVGLIWRICLTFCYLEEKMNEVNEDDG